MMLGSTMVPSLIQRPTLRCARLAWGKMGGVLRQSQDAALRSLFVVSRSNRPPTSAREGAAESHHPTLRCAPIGMGSRTLLAGCAVGLAAVA